MKRKIISSTYLRDVDKYQIKFFLDEDDYYVSVKKLIKVREKFIIKNNICVMDDNYYVVEVVPIGIMIVTNYKYKTDDDLDINFRSGEGGSSGGLVLSLGIYSKITGIDLLKGRNIAGTGTIDIDGNVGEIDGIKYKIAGAVRKHMDVILVSPYNYEEAKKVIKENNYDIELVKVSTFKEAINYLTQ